ncbi:MAG: TIGR03032 family protein [Xanthomonadales bacterium]|nr:TIGR03032 family protein [Xanthomonadales bacterium]
MAHQFASQSTDSFRVLLEQSGTSLVVSTYQAGQLVLVRAQEKGVNTHFIGFGKPMGLAWKPGELSVGGAAQVVTYRNLPAVATKLDDGSPADACYIMRGTHATGAIDIHEMGYDSTGDLWFINTRMSCLCTRSPDFSFVPRWRPPFITEYELSDRCHLNGLGFRDGQPRYVTMLGNTDTGGGWRQNKTSGGLVMDIETDEVLADQLCMPHSPRWYRDKLWFLSSGAGQLMCVEDGKAQVVAEIPGFARGMDFIDRYALIGLSQVRESAVFAGLPLTRRVAERKSGVWVVDLETGETVAFLEFIGDVQEVFEVRVLPHRFPALLDTDSPLVANSFELPDEVLNNLAPPDPVQQALEAATRAHMNGKFADAIGQYQAILASHPEHRQTKHQLGLCLVDAERWHEAVELLSEVVEEQTDNAEAMNSLGLAHSRLGDYEKGIEWFERSIETDQQFALAHFNRGLILLKLGRYEEGWPGFDWRWQTPQFVPFQCNKPQWQGEDISDKRLLVHSEQGNGDHIQFMRFLPMVAEKCKELIYVGPEKLAPLAAEIEGVSESRVPGQIPQDRFDVYCPLMSLPRWLGITRDNIPAPERYLKIPEQVVVRKLEGQFKVGIAWAGSPTQKDDKRRSMQLDTLAPLFEVDGVDFFSVQMPISGEESALLEKHGITNLEPELPGYARTAALVDQLDLVITVDTAVAHVAGALGKPVWILLNADPDWRWGIEGEATPWYPTARLFRQAKPRDWSPVIDRVRQALEEISQDR